MSRAGLSDTTLYYREVGAGMPCLVMHGGLGLDHTYLHPGLDPLGDVLRLVYYDHRCHGRSGRPPLETLTYEQLAADDADASALFSAWSAWSCLDIRPAGRLPCIALRVASPGPTGRACADGHHAGVRL